MTVDEYLASVPNDVRIALEKVRRSIRTAIPRVEERIAYRIPVFRLDRDLVGFSAQRDPRKRLCSFYTMSPALAEKMKEDLQGYKVSGATVHFSPDRPLPASLVRKIVRARLAETAEQLKGKERPRKSQ
jgi:uncharacterized protein YdhG (YjbR/CyaY superfamily)